MLTAHFEFIATNPLTGKVRRSGKKRCHSFVKQFLQLYYIDASGSQTITVNDITGAGIAIGGLSEIWTSSAFFPVINSAGRGGSAQGYCNDSGGVIGSSTKSGIVVGTGTNAVAVTDYALQTIIADGTSAGQLEYLSCAGTQYSVAAPSASFKIERLWRNSSGGTITINEVAIYAAGSGTPTFGTGFWDNAPYFFCLLRDLVSPAFSLLTTEYLQIIFTLTVTV